MIMVPQGHEQGPDNMQQMRSSMQAPARSGHADLRGMGSLCLHTVCTAR